MGRSARIGIVLGVLLGSSLPSKARAQTLPPPSAVSTHNLLPAVPQLHLTWPVMPLRFSFDTSEEITGFAGGPQLLYRVESLWLDRRSLQLLTTGASERAYELDCRLTCQPVVRRMMALEARVALPSSAVAPGNYAFVRSASFASPSPGGSHRLLDVGFAGSLNF